MRINEVSKRYAKALLAVTKQQGSHSKALVELQTVATAISSDAAIQNFFSNPMIATDKKVATIKEVFSGKGLSQEVLNTLVLLGEKDRLNIIAEMALAFQELLDAEEGITRGTVRSAQPLSVEAQKEIEQKLSKVLNKKIVLTFQQDAKLLGGIVAQAGGWTFDDSIDTHLKKLNEELNRSAN